MMNPEDQLIPQDLLWGKNIQSRPQMKVLGGGIVPSTFEAPTGPTIESGMTPYNISDQAVKKFVESPLIAQATGRQNVGNVPMGEFLRLATNTPLEPPAIPAAPPAGGGGLIPPTVQTPKSAADLARADAMAEWEAHKAAVAAGKKPADSGFGLSPLFFANHPEVSGGVFVGPNGPQFLFSENKPKDTLTAANDLVRQMSEKVASALSGGDASMAQFFGTQLNSLLNQIAPMINAQTGATKAPSEIAANMAAAKRAQIVPNVAVGPEGGAGSFLIPPGGQPAQFATGTPAIPEKNTIVGMVNQGYLEFMKEASRIDADPLIPPEQKTAAHTALQTRFRDYFNGLQNLASRGNQPGAGTKPILQNWLPEARKANPGKSDAELTIYFNQKYGR